MFIVSTGLVCSVGLTADAACAAMRAGIAGFDELPYVDNQGEPIIGAMVPGLDPELKRGERLIEMLSMALTDCLNKQPNLDTLRTPLLVGLAEPDRPGGGAHMADSIIKAVEEKLGVRFHPQYSKAICKGHTAGFECLQIARELLTQGSEVTGCLVCGGDSYINARSLLWLDQHWRLKREDHSDGVIPGEGAGAVYCQSENSNSLARVEILGLGFGVEEANVFSDYPLQGEGLTNATQTALAEANLGLHDVDCRISDVTGESYGFREQSLMLTRVQRVKRNESPLWHCADTIGDIGAAAGLSQFSLALDAVQLGYAIGRRTACFTSASAGDRAVAIGCY